MEIESPSESWLKGISDKYGFTIERHTLEVFGLCEDCRKRTSSGCLPYFRWNRIAIGAIQS